MSKQHSRRGGIARSFAWITSTVRFTPLPTTLSWSDAKEYQRSLCVRDRVCFWCRETLNPPGTPMRMKKYTTAIACSNSHRALLRNCMEKKATRSKVSRRLKEIGHHPIIRGGNGTGMTAPQMLLLSTLGKTWRCEHVVPTGARMRGGPPTHYKLDIALPEKMIAVEVDGMSHRTLHRQAADARKTTWLESHGWCVLRFSNQEVLSSLNSVIERIQCTLSK